MFEETNQAEPAEGGTDIFDFGEEAQESPAPEDTNSAGEQEAAVNPEPKSEAPAAGEPTYKVTYNGRELELPAAELIVQAQKGMNYDHVREQLEQMRENPLLAAAQEAAGAVGMTPEQYAAALRAEMQSRQIEAQTKSGIPREVAERLYNLEQENQRRGREQEAAAQEAETMRQYRELAQEYPDAKELPAEVISAVAKGETPLNAYRAYENAQLKMQLAALRQNGQAKKKDAGSLQPEAGADDPDGFLAAFEQTMNN